MEHTTDLADQVLIALRRILRAIDLHSHQISQHHGLTVPQLIVLKTVAASGRATVGELARSVSLSNATVTAILDRLERRGLITRSRGLADKRRVQVDITEDGRDVLASAPSLLHERFIGQFGRLEEWEQTLILSSLQRVAAMMDATRLDVAPLLSGEAIASPDPALTD